MAVAAASFSSANTIFHGVQLCKDEFTSNRTAATVPLLRKKTKTQRLSPALKIVKADAAAAADGNPNSTNNSTVTASAVTLTTKVAAPEAAEDLKHVWKDVWVGERWREIQGERYWEGLYSYDAPPSNIEEMLKETLAAATGLSTGRSFDIDPTLRAEVIRYGEFAQITYDAFDFDTHSIYCGSCKYSRRMLFDRVGKSNCGYEVKKYIYATSTIELPKILKRTDRSELEADHRWSGDSNWMGYIAVSTDPAEIRRLGRRDIVIAWRGTITKSEWIDDMAAAQVKPGIEPETSSGEDIRVEMGFHNLYTCAKPDSKFNRLSARDQMMLELKRLLKEYEGEQVSITITGHSLGGALAVLSGYDIITTLAANTATSTLAPMVTVFSFAGPAVGNHAFKRRVESELGLRVLRIVNEHDKVPNTPWLVLSSLPTIWHRTAEAVLPGLAYHHIGKELRLDFDASPFLQPGRDVGNHHNLEAYLHVLDGFHGRGRTFESVFNRSPSLVNKSCGYLVKEAYIPPCWWQEHNKGLVQNENGQWVLAAREEEHLPENHHP